MSQSTDFISEREHMVRKQIEARGIDNPQVLEAMRGVPRHRFVPENMASMAHADRPLPIGQDQTISQPYIVAYMTQCLRLRGGERVLEIGTGLGYQAAVLSRIASEVYSIERFPDLADRAREILASLGYDNVSITCGDGTKGWPEKAPFDGIIATASGPRVPDSLKEQLRMGGRIVMPVGSYRMGQNIVRLTKGSGDRFQEENLLGVAFVPMVGEEGWQE
jgi:protein-L-isoaspartate(D-aspartate) O-methyltransferase